ncbi:AAA-domain-containing protein [Podospora aff. communis PSN243]|uniref:AAA-domain-containing protein n=1 Tax=Podospora aff. communis PSN243 TaxID=3040156 RepID=A0AAV9GDX5_9PEZI|nr:AAA-domain-containing protein [Podospora aff. communis PSN243]
MTMTASLLHSGNPLYEQIRNQFDSGWDDQTKTYTIKTIYRLGSNGPTGREIDLFQALASPRVGSRLTFLGARRACYIGDRDPDDSVMNHYVRSHAHVMVVCATSIVELGMRFAQMNVQVGPVPVALVVYTKKGWKLESPPPENPAESSPPPTQQHGQGSSNKSSSQTEEAKLKESLANAIVSKKPNVKWGDIAGLAEAKKVLEQTLVFPQRFPNLFSAERKPPRAILLYGPPGTGKSYLASAVATEVDYTLFRISSADVMSKWFGESEKLVRQLFVLARQKKPAIIFIDEIDALCRTRDGPDGGNEHTSRMKTELLVQMQGLDSDSDGLVVLAATNLPWALDPAARRRFQKRIYVPLPDQKAREELFRIHSGGRILTTDQLSELARRTDGFSGSDISNFVEEVLRLPLDVLHAATHFKKVVRRGSEFYTPCESHEGGAIAMTWQEIPAGNMLEEPHVTAQDFFRILEGGKVKSTVSLGECGKYEEWTETYGVEGK